MSGFHQKLIIQLVEVLILMNSTGPFHAQCKKIEKIKNDDLDLIYVYFSSIISYEYPFIEKNCPKLTKKNFFRHFYQESWHSVLDGTGMFSLPIFYQMLNKRSKQHSLLHFLTGKLDQTGFLILLWQFDLLDMLCGKAREKNNLQCWKFNLLVKCKRECVLIVSNVQFGSVLKIFLLLIFSDLPYKNRKLKKKICPI